MNNFQDLLSPVEVANFNDLEDRKPMGVLVENTDLVMVRFDEKVSILYGRCLHRGGLLSGGHI
ncbi:MAG: Rieske 2Fe-2S domain-containing protein, partial [Saprospiraceae bacterium]|nr:Rieske 2Fe-2S domain-containing protein [Saprospiraceae bacterium]